jgi:tRNA dimethylallyltransferase
MNTFVALVGPTASGKTDLAIELAEQFGGEIVCADSRTFYRGMDIGTAKPTLAQQARVPHHLLDVANPDDPISAAVFKALACAEIKQISARGQLPFLVGGSGLYAYGVIYDYMFPAGPRSQQRVELERLLLPELVARLEREDPERAAEIDVKNARRVVRALETIGQPRQMALKLSPNVLLLGVRQNSEILDARIEQRTDGMIEMGLLAEVTALVKRYGSDLEVFKSPGYGEIVEYLHGAITFDEARSLICLHTRQLVKRQLTWLKRNHEIQWLPDAEEVRLREACNLVQGFIRTRAIIGP